jgi:hypothetical protein
MLIGAEPVSANYATVLGAHTVIGRWFTREDEPAFRLPFRVALTVRRHHRDAVASDAILVPKAELYWTFSAFAGILPIGFPVILTQ